MTDEKPLTKSGLLAIFKEVGIATKENVRAAVGEELAARGVATKDDVTSAKDELRGEIGGLERRLKLRMGKMRTNLLRAIGNLATSTPTMRAFRELKAKLDHYVGAS